MATDTKDVEDEKATKAETAEGKATADGDVTETVNLLKYTKDELATARATCIQVAADHEATVKARNEELKEDTASGAASQTYSMLQASCSQNRQDLAELEVVQLAKQLTRKHHSSALAQPASHMAAAVRFGTSGGEHPVAKMLDLIETPTG